MGVVFEHATRTTIIIRVAKQFGKMDLRTGLVVVVLILATGGWSGTDREQSRGWISRHPLCGLNFTLTSLDIRNEFLNKKYAKKYTRIELSYFKYDTTRAKKKNVDAIWFFLLLLIFETPLNTTRTSRASTAN